jgi:hypothetical protein
MNVIYMGCVTLGTCLAEDQLMLKLLEREVTFLGLELREREFLADTTQQ